MTKEKMNIHKALCELKILDSRIAKEIRNLNAAGVTKKVSQMVGSQRTDDFKQTGKDQIKKVLDLINRRSAIKEAVVLSNAKTVVNIGGVNYTIAEAIEMKNHGLDGKKSLLRHLTGQLMEAERQVQLANDRAERDADVYVQTVFGGKDNKGNASEIASARKTYLETQVVELVDAVGIRVMINKLDDEINAFTSEVDAALSVSNANTEIEIEY